MNGFLQDLRYALRAIGKNPGCAAVAVLTSAIAIGRKYTKVCVGKA
jgi:hypothetical protein